MELEEKQFSFINKLKSMHMCLRQVSGRGHGTHDVYDSTHHHRAIRK